MPRPQCGASDFTASYIRSALSSKTDPPAIRCLPKPRVTSDEEALIHGPQVFLSEVRESQVFSQGYIPGAFRAMLAAGVR